MAQCSGTIPGLTAGRGKGRAAAMRAVHGKARDKKSLSTQMPGGTPAPRLPGGLAVRRALAHAKARGR